MQLEVSPAKIQADFDRLALLEAQEWGHNNHYHKFLLKQLPAKIENGLEIGCGTGGFCRLLATGASKVTGLDFSHEMIRLAKKQAVDFPQLEFLEANFLTHDFKDENFDCVASIATLHHLPMRETLPIIKNLLKPGGTLLILDLYQAANWGDKIYAGAAILPNIFFKLIKNGRIQDSPEVRAAWEEHGKTDVYLTLSELKQISQELLPGAKITRHFFWRYSLVWQKPLT